MKRNEAREKPKRNSKRYLSFRFGIHWKLQSKEISEERKLNKHGPNFILSVLVNSLRDIEMFSFHAFQHFCVVFDLLPTRYSLPCAYSPSFIDNWKNWVSAISSHVHANWRCSRVCVCVCVSRLMRAHVTECSSVISILSIEQKHKSTKRVAFISSFGHCEQHFLLFIRLYLSHKTNENIQCFL